MLELVFDVLFNQFYIEIKGASQGPRPADNASFISPLSPADRWQAMLPPPPEIPNQKPPNIICVATCL